MVCLIEIRSWVGADIRCTCLVFPYSNYRSEFIKQLVGAIALYQILIVIIDSTT